MKRILFYILFFFLIITPPAFATDYYVKNGGNNGNTGLNDGQAWETLVYALSQVSANDTIFFNRGDTFREEGVIVDSDITIDAYGSGALPIITGAETVSGGWTQHSGNIYYATVTGAVYGVLRENVWVDVAREPDNADFMSSSYTADGSGGSRFAVVETGDDMGYSEAQIVGASILQHALGHSWASQMGVVASYSSNTINIPDNGEQNLATMHTMNGDMYWLLNKLIFLDQAGEWFHDPATNRLYVWQVGDGDPDISGDTWEVIQRSTGLSATTKPNLTIQNVHIEKFAAEAIYFKDCSNFDVNNSTFSYNGNQIYRSGYEGSHRNGVGLWSDGQGDEANEGGSFAYNTLTRNFEGGVYARGVSYVTVFTNTITYAGYENCFRHGEGIQGGWSYDGYWSITYNTVEYTGYNGIGVGLRNTNISNNTISNTMRSYQDGGAIYQGSTVGGGTINDNVITNVGLDTVETSANEICGIYLDVGTPNNTLDSNIVINAGWCFYSNGGDNNEWTNNECYEFRYRGAIFEKNDVSQGDPDSLIFTGNTLHSTKSTVVYTFNMQNWVDDDDPFTWFADADLDNNSYYPDGAEKFAKYHEAWTKYNFAGYQSASGRDDNSTISTTYPAISDPNPAHNGTGVGEGGKVSFTGAYAANTYDIYFDKTTNPPTSLVADDTTDLEYDPPGNMDGNSDYYWEVRVNHDSGTKAGSVFKFTTAEGSLPPTPASVGVMRFVPKAGLVKYKPNAPMMH